MSYVCLKNTAKIAMLHFYKNNVCENIKYFKDICVIHYYSASCVKEIMGARDMYQIRRSSCALGPM